MEYAAFLLNRFEVGRDGKTSFERCAGKKAKVLGVEFGEGIFWKKKREGGALGKLSSTWTDGVFLGVRGRSGEIIIGTKTGVWKARSIQRKPLDARWLPELMDMVRHPPWRCSDDDPEADGEALAVKMNTDELEKLREVETKAVIPRQVYISKKDLEVHGYTAKCPGCVSILLGKTRQGIQNSAGPDWKRSLRLIRRQKGLIEGLTRPWRRL